MYKFNNQQTTTLPITSRLTRRVYYQAGVEFIEVAQGHRDFSF